MLFFLFNLLFLVNRNNPDLLKASPSLLLDWGVYANSTYGIKIKYPRTWNYRLKDNPWDSFIIFFPIDDKQSGARIAISVEPLSELITLEEYAESFKKNVLKFNEESRFIEQKEASLLHTDAYKVLYDFKRDGKRVKKMAIVTLRNKQAYIIYYEAELNSFSKFELVMQSMVDSLEFTNP